MADTTLHLENQLQAALQPGYMFWAPVITFWGSSMDYFPYWTTDDCEGSSSSAD